MMRHSASLLVLGAALAACDHRPPPPIEPTSALARPWSPPSDPTAIWSVAELTLHRQLTQNQIVWLEGYAVRVSVEPCSCPEGAACAPCAADVSVGDTPDAPARRVVSILLPGDVGLRAGRRYQFSATWLRWDTEPAHTAFAVLSYGSHRQVRY